MRKDPVTPSLHAAVLRRDRGCVLAHLESAHECRDVWGVPHRSDDLAKLSIEHVKSEPMMGRRAPSDLQHLVALCYAANVGVPSKEQREQFREYLASFPVMDGAKP